jgi:hypothetical protein
MGLLAAPAKCYNALINDAPICVDDDFRKTLRHRLCANLMCGN